MVPIANRTRQPFAGGGTRGRRGTLAQMTLIRSYSADKLCFVRYSDDALSEPYGT